MTRGTGKDTSKRSSLRSSPKDRMFTRVLPPHILLLSCRDPRSGGPSGRLTTRGEGEGYEGTLGLYIFAREFSSQAHSAPYSHFPPTSRPTSSSTYIPLQPFAPFGHRLISQVLRLNLITASGSFPTVFHLQH